jgi:hypothetical protein
MSSWSTDEEVLIANFLVSKVVSKASGESDLECINNFPRDAYFIGCLSPEVSESNDDERADRFSHEMHNKLSPSAFGSEFNIRLSEPVTVLNIKLSWSCYYRIFPTFQQQRTHQFNEVTSLQEIEPLDDTKAKVKIDPSVVEGDGLISDIDQASGSYEPDVTKTPNGKKEFHDSMFIRFRKVDCCALGTIELIKNNGNIEVKPESIESAIHEQLKLAKQIVKNDKERIRTSKTSSRRVTVPDCVLINENEYTQYLVSLTEEHLPMWSWRCLCSAKAVPKISADAYMFTIEFTNNSHDDIKSPTIEPFFFSTKAVFSIKQNLLIPSELDLAPKGFRYNRNYWGKGINCSVNFTHNTEDVLTTEHAPLYKQNKFVTRSTPKASFSDLATDPIPILKSILDAMIDYRKVWESEELEYISRIPNWEETHKAEYLKDKESFDYEIQRYRIGLDILIKDKDILHSFKLTNESFRRGRGKTAWRLFQIVFLVCQIPGIASLRSDYSDYESERELVDIIYFPTGGGKTEAYLATIIFHCFFDRLRGKSCGVTAWTRFPLRLLTLQQTQRVADVIGQAELVRREQQDTRLNDDNIDGFSVGYFVGEGGSPNSIVNPSLYQYATPEDQVTWSKVHDEKLRQDWKRVVSCPHCGTDSIIVEFDDRHTKLIHKCTNKGCLFPNGVLPVFIVDNEIYRYLPTVLVGTIDKLAGVGNQSKFAMIFGKVHGVCTEHGYYKVKCCQKDCQDVKRLVKIVPAGLSGPTLIIQDELHLLKEGLGTFDAHYETFMQEVLHEYGEGRPVKVIASSATIEAFERQVNHLYGRDSTKAIVFPSLGPTYGNSFYAETLNSPQRLYVGLMPHNKTIFNAILELIESYHRELSSLTKVKDTSINPYGGSVLPGSVDWNYGIDLYRTVLTYFLAKRELSSVHTDLEGDVIPRLSQDVLPSFNISELTGDTTTDMVSRILERLEKNVPIGGLSDVVLASSMISHGVDIDRFNAMFFYGMPRLNAEYIQASSRVGRSHVGIVFSCFHPVRERDQSHYSYFCKFHEFIGQLVEPVAINRWSQFSINRTLPGLFMGVLLQIIANRLDNINPGALMKLSSLKQKINDGSITVNEIVSFLHKAYKVNELGSQGEVVFHNEIIQRIQQYFDWIRTPNSTQDWVSDILIPKPMRSLRDVDEPIPIELDPIGTNWSQKSER